MLFYDTTDEGFAERALAALRAAGISCYKISTSVLGNKSLVDVPDDVHFYLHVERSTDYRAASDILIKLGAVVDGPSPLPPLPVLILLAALAVAIAIFVAINWGPA